MNSLLDNWLGTVYRTRMDTDRAKVWLKSVLYRTRLRARGQGVEFLLVERDVELVERCPVLAIRLHYGSVGFNGATLARKNMDKGWIAGNVWIICRSVCGVMMSKGYWPRDAKEPFHFLSEADRQRLYSEVRKKREEEALRQEFNTSFPVENLKAKFPDWINTYKEDTSDPVDDLRRQLNKELLPD